MPQPNSVLEGCAPVRSYCIAQLNAEGVRQLLRTDGPIAEMERAFSIRAQETEIQFHGALAMLAARATRKILACVADAADRPRETGRWDYHVADSADQPHVAVLHNEKTVLSVPLVETYDAIAVVHRLNALDRLLPLMLQALAPGGIGPSSFDSWRRELAEAALAATAQDVPSAEAIAKAEKGDLYVEWKPTHVEAAAAEGWCFADCCGGAGGRWQINRIDDPELAGTHLASDDAAWQIVAKGSEPHHQLARDLLKRFNPRGWIEFCQATRFVL